MKIPISQELIGDSVLDIPAAIKRMEYMHSLRSAESHCKAYGIPIPVDLSVKMRRAGIFSRAYKGGSDYDSIRTSYWESVYGAVSGYLESTKPSTSYKSAMSQAVAKAFVDAVNAGYVEGGGELPLDEDTNEWLTGWMNSELSNVGSLFVSLALLRKEDDTDPVEEGFRRAEGYANTLDGLFNTAILYGMKNKMLTFSGSDGAESCKDCQNLKGQRHRASWFIAHDSVPPSGLGLECHPGGRCEHYLEDDDGVQVTV